MIVSVAGALDVAVGGCPESETDVVDLQAVGVVGSVLGRSEQGAFPALRLAGRPHI